MNYNKMIDHTVLKADATKAMVAKIIDEAKEYNFASVCVNPTWVAYCAQALADSDVKVCTVIGFPLGANTSAVKAFETKDAIANGADEIDMVINLGDLMDKNYGNILSEITKIKSVCEELVPIGAITKRFFTSILPILKGVNNASYFI